MAVETLEGNFLLEKKELSVFPLDSKDFNTGKCRMHVSLMKLAGLNVNSRVSIQVKHRKMYCTLWPLGDQNFPPQNLIQIDPTVARNTDDSAEVVAITGCFVDLFNDINLVRVCLARVIEVTVYARSLEDMSARLAYDKQRRSTQVRCILQDKVFTQHCWVHVRKLVKCGLGFTEDIDRIFINKMEYNDTIDEQDYHVENRTPEVAGAVYVDTKIIVKSIKQYKPTLDRKKSICLAVYGDVVNEIHNVITMPDRFLCEKPNGFLLLGPPGVGKSSLVSYLADSWDAELFVLNGADIFEAHIGESERNLRKTFERARGASTYVTCVLFIDEIDVLCPRRSQGNDVENRVASQLITLIDEIVSQNSSIVLIAATNRPNVLDPALRRPGRFDKEFVIGMPSCEQRLKILTSLVQSLPLSSDVQLDVLAKQCLGYVAADLAALVRQSTMNALTTTMTNTERKIGVTMADFQRSFSTIVPSTYRGVDGIVESLPVKWEDIAGYEQVKQALRQAVEWPFLYPEAFSRLGLSQPRGILLYGPPGCSKTTLVCAAATSCHCTFLSLSCAQLYSPYVGDAERMIREIFTKARAAAPAILFLDEVDAVVRKRSTDGSCGVDARILSTLLNEIDGIGISSNVYETKHDNSKLSAPTSVSNQRNILFVAATNRPQVLDEAILRPGRVDRVVYVPHPDRDTRFHILKLYCKRMPVADNVDPEMIADKTELFSGADLKNVCREAALNALQDFGVEKCSQVEQRHFLQALSSISASLSLEQVKVYETMALCW